MYKVENRGSFVFVFVDEGYSHFEGPSRISESAGSLEHVVNQTLDETSGKVPLLLDLRKFKITWSELVLSLSETNKSDSVFRHPNLSRVLVVTDNGLIKLGAMALSQAQYGSKAINVFKTVEEALAVVEQMVA